MQYSFYAGCATKEASDKGIHLLRFDAEKGDWQVADSLSGGENPNFLTKAGNFLYSVNANKACGKVSAFSVGANGSLTYLNSKEAFGFGSCHVAVMNGYLYAANYASGGIFGVKILADGMAAGSVGDVVCEVQHQGSGPNEKRQAGPHAHSVNPIPGTDLLIAADLGTDSLYCYRQQKDGKLVLDSSAAAPPGAGPRHMAFHQGNNHVYAVTELGITVVSYKFSGKNLSREAVYPLMKEMINEKDSAADIHITADGKRLYASTRGRNILSAFDIGADGALKFIGTYPTHGDGPRNFCITPDDKFAVIANMVSGNVVVCPIDPKTGALGNLICSVNVHGPACVINAL